MRGLYNGLNRYSNLGTAKAGVPKSHIDKRNLECYKCHMYGHFAHECQEREVGYMAFKSPKGGKQPNAKAGKKAKGKNATSDKKQVATVASPTLNQ